MRRGFAKGYICFIRCVRRKEVSILLVVGDPIHVDTLGVERLFSVQRAKSLKYWMVERFDYYEKFEF